MQRYPKGRGLEVSLVRYSKADLESVPPEHRSFYLLLGHCNNELVMLQGIMIRCTTSFGQSPAVQETALGMFLYFSRLMAGRIYETWTMMNAAGNGQLLDRLWQDMAQAINFEDTYAEAKAGQKELNKYFGRSNALLRRVRHELAFHTDQQGLENGFESMPSEIGLTDYHAGRRGTTFFGASDTVAMYALMKLTGANEAPEACRLLLNDVLDCVRQLGDFIEGYMLAFTAHFVGIEQIVNGEKVFLPNVPQTSGERLSFWTRPR